MISKPESRAQVKPERRIRVIQPPDAEGKNAEICITINKSGKTEVFRYWVDRIPSDWGAAFLVEK